MTSIQSIEQIKIERTIYDPVTSSFILSQPRPLPNVREWIYRNDRSAYWYILCIHNNSDTTIDEWGVVLECSSGIFIPNVGIEGVDHPLTILQSQTKPWLIRWTLGLSHELGVVIPRGGSKRIYFKLSSNACGVDYAINGIVTTPHFEIPIREKKYSHSCDVPTLKTAMVKDPEKAVEYTENILTHSYDRDTALKLLTSFRLLLDINRCCQTDQYEEMLDKLQLLNRALENANVKKELLDGLKNAIDAIKILDRGEASSARGVRLCNSLVDEWIQDILIEHGNFKFPKEGGREPPPQPPKPAPPPKVKPKTMALALGLLIIIGLLWFVVAPLISLLPPASIPSFPNTTIPTITSTPITISGSEKIAFTSYRDGNGEVYLMNTDGTEQRSLTNNPANDYAPVSWSPDRSKIAFNSDVDRKGEIFIMNADGSGRIDISNNQATDFLGEWSPDGSKIVFCSNRDGLLEVYIMNPSGTQQTRLTRNSADEYNPSWSPDGTRIIFDSYLTGDSDIYVMNADGSGLKLLATNPAKDSDPEYSPNGAKIVFSSERDGNSEIYLMNADGSGQIDLTNNPAYDWMPTWSPDGSKIAFVSNRNGNNEIYLMNSDGSGQTRLTNDPSDDVYPFWIDLATQESEAKEPITPLVQAGTPFTNNKYAQNTPRSNPMVFTCYWSGDGQVWISGDEYSVTPIRADDGYIITIQPSGASFTSIGTTAGPHPPIELTTGMRPGVNTFTLTVQNWGGLSMSYGSFEGDSIDQIPFIIQVNA